MVTTDTISAQLDASASGADMHPEIPAEVMSVIAADNDSQIADMGVDADEYRSVYNLYPDLSKYNDTDDMREAVRNKILDVLANGGDVATAAFEAREVRNQIISQAATQAQTTQAAQPTHPTDRDSLINRAANSVIDTLDGLTLPDLLDPDSDAPEQIRGQIISNINIVFELENRACPKSAKLKTPQSLPGYVVARVILRTNALRLMMSGSAGAQMIAKKYYKDGNVWKWSGMYYRFSEKDLSCQVMRIFQRLAPNGTAQDIATFCREIRRAPVAYLQRDDKLVWFRNGVWDFRTMSLTPYDDKDFERKYPTQITLGKLPVYHPYGPGAVLHPDAARVVAEPVIHNDKDGTDWHPGQMLTDPFDMTTKEGQASSLIIWQSMQFTLRHTNGAPGLYHFWVNGNGRGHNGKSAIWSMIRRLLTRDLGPGDDDLQSPNNTKMVIQKDVSELKTDFTLSQNIQTAYAIVGEETSAGSGTTYVDECATAKMLARGQELAFRAIYGEPFSFTYRGLLLQQSNKAPIFAEKNDSIISHTVVIRFERSFDDSRPYIKDDYVLREEVAEWLAYKLTVDKPCLDAYDSDALKVLAPNKREMLTESMPSLRFLDEVVPELRMRVMPLELLYEMYVRWCDVVGEKDQSMRVLRDDLQQWANNNAYGVDFFAPGHRVRTDMDDLQYMQRPLSEYRETRKHSRNKFCDPRAWGIVSPDKVRLLAGSLNIDEMCYVDHTGKAKPKQWNKGGLIRTIPWQKFAQNDTEDTE